MSKLLDSGSESDGENEELKINEGYASNYNKFREKEVYQRLKSKYGEDAAKKSLEAADFDDSSSDESEDETAEGLTEEIERDFFKTMSYLKNKDPRIYDEKTSFFRESEAGTSKSTKKERPMFIGDLERKVVLEKDGKFEEMEDEDLKAKSESKTYVQELEDIKKSFKDAVESSDEEEDLLSKKHKTEEEKAQEEADYKKWLKGVKGSKLNEKDEKELDGLKSYWNKKDLDKNEKFLRDYILNQKYLGDSEEEEYEKNDDENLSEDEKTVEKQEEFEVKYNFRFEEPDEEFIKKYPRTIQDTMRKTSNARKEKRDEVKARKQAEKEKKREELKQLKSLKRKEILGKIQKLQKITGSDDIAFKEEDIENDFNAEEYDRRMKEIFENYNDNEEVDDEEKPVFSDSDEELEQELEGENWDDFGGEDEEEEKERAGPSKDLEKEMVEKVKGPGKLTKFGKAINRKKPIFDPNDKTFEEYLDEYYKLDYEDDLGDLKCRFPYRHVERNDFGLSTEEVLAAPDRELNAWCSLKKTCQYRTPDEELNDKKEYERKGKNSKMKTTILPSLFAENNEEVLQQEQEKKASKGKRRRKRKRNEQDEEEKTEAIEEEEGTEKKKNKKRRKRNKGAADGEAKKKKFDVNQELKMSDDRLQAYGQVPNQFKRKARKKHFREKQDG